MSYNPCSPDISQSVHKAGERGMDENIGAGDQVLTMILSHKILLLLWYIFSDPLPSYSPFYSRYRQGLMFGYATDETEEAMPLTCILAHQLNAKLAELRRNGEMGYLRPDSKTQV